MANLGTNNVSAYTIDEKSGRLVPVAGSPFPAGTFPSAIAVDPLGKYVYVTNSMSNNVSGYAINSTTGALTPLSGSPFAAQEFTVVRGSGSERQVGLCGESRLERYLRILHRSNQWRAQSTEWVALCRGRRGSELGDRGPNGQYVYLAGYGGLFVYSINQFAPISMSLGVTPVSGSPFGGGTPNFVAVDYTGTFLYAANRSSNDISAYKISSSSTLTPIPGSPFTAVADPVSIALVRPRTHPIYSATEIPESGRIRICLQHQRIGD